MNGRSSTKKVIYLSVFVAAVLCAWWYLAQRHVGRFSSDSKRDVKVEAARQSSWAKPLELPGVLNLHKVSDELYRGAQPTAEGMQELEKLGIKTIINLRSFHSDIDEIGQTRLAYEHIETSPWSCEDEDVIRFLRIVTDPNRTPVFVHCQRGADRTGIMCAAYRIAVEGWSKQKALEEMIQGGFGFYSGWKNIIRYVTDLDIEQIKYKAGMTHAPPP
jgi:protein tyrosine/serine phosphatase